MKLTKEQIIDLKECCDILYGGFWFDSFSIYGSEHISGLDFAEVDLDNNEIILNHNGMCIKFESFFKTVEFIKIDGINGDNTTQDDFITTDIII